MENRGISKLDLKRRNRMQILRVIRESGPISRVDVASALEDHQSCCYDHHK